MYNSINQNKSIYDEAISSSSNRGNCSNNCRINTSDINYSPNYTSNYRGNLYSSNNNDRVFWAPFAIGGLAGTALGFGIANNNQLNNGWGQPVYWVPRPTYYPYNNFNNYYY